MRKLINFFFLFFVAFQTNIAIAQSNSNNESLQNVMNNYISLKDALALTDAEKANQAAKQLLTSLDQIQKNSLSPEVQTLWAKLSNDLKEDAEHIGSTTEITHQRDHFMSLSQNLYTLTKNAHLSTTLYYQFCPMANKGKGANWLSLEQKVRNPYYGAKMLSCGKVSEVIK
jgi:hypothetical protein